MTSLFLTGFLTLIIFVGLALIVGISDISSIEEQIEKLDAEIASNASNSVELQRLFNEQSKLKEELEYKMDRWMYLEELADKIANQ